MVMKKEDCWMSFSEALDQYLRASRDLDNARARKHAEHAEQQLEEARDHMDALTDSTDLRSS